MLTGKAICSILRAGFEAKAATIEVDGLKIVYLGAETAPSNPSFIHYRAPDSQSSGEPEPESPKPQPDLTELMITDPAAYEAEVLREHA